MAAKKNTDTNPRANLHEEDGLERPAAKKTSRREAAASATPGAAITTLELAKGKSREYWTIEVHDDTLTITSGTVGGKKPPKQQSKTLKSSKAAEEAAGKEIAKKKKAHYFDPSSLEGILEAHHEHLTIPTEQDMREHRAALPHASDDYFRVYASGALSVGFFSDFAPGAEAPRGQFEFAEITGLFPAYSARDELDEEGAALDPLFYVVGTYPDGSAVLHYNAGKHAGCLGLAEHGVSDDLMEHVVAGDPDATVDAWQNAGLIEPISNQSWPEVVRQLLLHYKFAAVERLIALRAALEAVRSAVSGDPLQITALDLSDKGLRTLPVFLGECQNLEVLSLAQNEFTQIPDVLRNLKKLRVLDLYYNEIDPSSLPAWLAELPLTDLNLASNQSGGKVAEVVSELTNLCTLRLPSLSGLPASIGQLTSLRQLEINGVKGVIEVGALGKLEQLEVLNLGSTGEVLGAPLPDDLGGMKALHTLKFGVTPNDGFPLPPSVAQLQSLRVLHAGSSTLTDAVCELATLEELKVSGNAAGLPARLGALASLRVLDLKHARMSTLPPSIGELANLTHLNLEMSDLESLPASFAKLTSLRDLNLNVRGPVELGELLAGMDNLEVLALSVRVLRTLRGSLRSLSKLETLKVYSVSEDELTLELFAFVAELPALKMLRAPYEIKQELRAAHANLTIE